MNLEIPSVVGDRRTPPAVAGPKRGRTTRHADHSVPALPFLRFNLADAFHIQIAVAEDLYGPVAAEHDGTTLLTVIAASTPAFIVDFGHCLSTRPSASTNRPASSYTWPSRSLPSSSRDTSADVRPQGFQVERRHGAAEAQRCLVAQHPHLVLGQQRQPAGLHRRQSSKGSSSRTGTHSGMTRSNMPSTVALT